jgi:hypothetical protein
MIMKLGSVLVGVIVGYAVHKYVGAQLDKGVDPAIQAVKDQINSRLKAKAEPAVASHSDAIQMS